MLLLKIFILKHDGWKLHPVLLFQDHLLKSAVWQFVKQWAETDDVGFSTNTTENILIYTER